MPTPWRRRGAATGPCTYMRLPETLQMQDTPTVLEVGGLEKKRSCSDLGQDVHIRAGRVHIPSVRR
jgi:hypothetical protein